MKSSTTLSNRPARWKKVASKWNQKSISEWFSGVTTTTEFDNFNRLMEFASEHADVIVPGMGRKPGFSCDYDVGDKTIAAWSIRSGKDFRLQIPFGALRSNLTQNPAIIDFYLNTLHQSIGEFSSIEIKGGWPTVFVKDLTDSDIDALKILAKEISRIAGDSR